MERLSDEYEVLSDEGEFCASSNNLDEAKHYAAVYSQDHAVKLVWVRRVVIDTLPKLNEPE